MANDEFEKLSFHVAMKIDELMLAECVDQGDSTLILGRAFIAHLLSDANCCAVKANDLLEEYHIPKFIELLSDMHKSNIEKHNGQN